MSEDNWLLCTTLHSAGLAVSLGNTEHHIRPEAVLPKLVFFAGSLVGKNIFLLTYFILCIFTTSHPLSYWQCFFVVSL